MRNCCSTGMELRRSANRYYILYTIYYMFIATHTQWSLPKHLHWLSCKSSEDSPQACFVLFLRWKRRATWNALCVGTVLQQHMLTLREADSSLRHRSLYIYIYICIHVYMYIYIYIFLFIYLFMYIYVFICLLISLFLLLCYVVLLRTYIHICCSFMFDRICNPDSLSFRSVAR